MNHMEAARIMIGGGNVGPMTDPIQANGTYKASDDGLDGYSQFTVAIPLSEQTFNSNGDFPRSVGGWNLIHIQVPTYWDELQAALARIAELEDCCDKVQDELINDWNPEDPVPAPTKPIDPEDIPDLMKHLPGYVFPDSLTLPQISEIVAGTSDPIIDTTVGRGILVTSIDTSGGERPGLEFWWTEEDGTAHWINAWASQGWYGDPPYEITSYYVDDPTIGHATINYTFRGTAYTMTWPTESWLGVPEWVGIGAAGHRYKTRNT